MRKLVMIGYIGKDAEVISPKEKQTFKPFVRFSVAYSFNITDKATGEIKQHTIWTNCIGQFEYLEKRISKLKSGTKVFIEGTPSSKIYQTEKEIDGKRKKFFKIDETCQITYLEIIQSKEQNTTAAPANVAETEIDEEIIINNDLPF